MNGVLTFSPIKWSHCSKFYLFLGNPSIRNFPFSHPFLCIASSRSLTVISLGTIFPSTMYFSINSPFFDPYFFLYSLRRSPAERWTKLKVFWINWLWVPFPDPGPPKMKMTVGLVISNQKDIIIWKSFIISKK